MTKQHDSNYGAETWESPTGCFAARARGLFRSSPRTTDDSYATLLAPACHWTLVAAGSDRATQRLSVRTQNIIDGKPVPFRTMGSGVSNFNLRRPLSDEACRGLTV